MGESRVESVAGVVVDLTEEAPLHVLLVDDEAGFLNSAKQCLELQGPFEVEIASSVEDATEKMQKKAYDAIISDYIMPGENGLEFLKQLRDGGNNIPFIIFTGKGREEVAIKALNLGADQYLNKVGAVETVYAEVAHGVRKAVERRKAAEMLKKSEEKYRSLFENAGDTILAMDLKGNIINVNRVIEEYGFKKDEVVGQNQLRFIPKKHWSRLLKEFMILASGRAVEGEVEVITPKGKIVAEYRSNPIRDGNKVVGIQTILRDISVRKKAEEELQKAHSQLESRVEERTTELVRLNERMKQEIIERTKIEKELKSSENRLKILFESAPDGIYLNDLKGNFVDGNKAAENMTGFKREELIGKNFLKIGLLPKSQTLKAAKLLAKNALGKPTGPDEFILNQKQGSQISVEIRTFPIKIRGQALVLGIARDITERKKMEEVLRKAHEKLEVRVHERTIELSKSNALLKAEITERKKAERALSENQQKFEMLFIGNPEAAVYTDPNFHILNVNPRFTKLFGYSLDEIRGKPINDVVVPKNKRVEAETLDKKAKKGYAHQDAMRKRKDGSLVPVSISAASIRTEDQLVGYVALYQDITKRRNVEEALKESLRRLETLTEKLDVVGKMTRHDVRNKLTAIYSETYLAKMKLPSNHEALEHLSAIESSVEQTARIFDFAKTYEKLGVEEPAYMDVEETVQEAVQQLPDLQVKVVNNCHGLSVLADSLLRQLFYNLIHNSLKHGQKITRIRVYYEEEKDRLKLIYEDDGVGIPDAEKEKIFQEGHGKGTGLGLFLIERMCNVYGWSIQETGKHSLGAQFTITIPRAVESGRVHYKFN